jgi:Collagen triple helix repeat (20 copies)
MYQHIRKHLTPSTLIAFVALVFALTGGAFAASSHNGSGSNPTASAGGRAGASNSLLATVAKAKAKTKAGPRGPAGPKGATGATGPAGPAGPAGATGPAGSQGPAGANGTNGSNGEAGKEGKQGEAGNEGSPWTDNGTLPAGSTETGTWMVSVSRATKEEIEGEVPPDFGNEEVGISFPIPLSAEPTPHYIETKEVEEEKLPDGCKGTAIKPEAEPGNLCVFATLPVSATHLEPETLQGISSGSGFVNPAFYLNISKGKFEGHREAGASPYGTVLVLTSTETRISENYALGTWAVTGS